MAEEIKKVISIEIKEAGKTVRKAKEEAEAAAGSYKALSKEMSALKKEWKETGDAAERSKLGEKIKSINDKLKEMDSTIGNHQRNVGNYQSALEGLNGKFGNMSKVLGQAVPQLGKMESGFGNLMKGAGKLSPAMAAVSLAILAVVAAVAKFVSETKEAIGRSEEFQTKLKQLGSVGETVNAFFDRLYDRLLNKVTPAIDWLNVKLDNLIKKLSNSRLANSKFGKWLGLNELNEINETFEDIAKSTEDIEKRKRDFIKEEADSKKKIADYDKIIEDKTKSQAERQKAIVDKEKEELRIAEKLRDLKRDEYELIKKKNSANKTSAEDAKAEAAAYAAYMDAETNLTNIQTNNMRKSQKIGNNKSGDSKGKGKSPEEEAAEAALKAYLIYKNELDNYFKTDLEKLEADYLSKKASFEGQADAEAIKSLEEWYTKEKAKIQRKADEDESKALLTHLQNVRDAITPSGTTAWWDANIIYLKEAVKQTEALDDGTQEYADKIMAAKTALNEAYVTNNTVIKELREEMHQLNLEQALTSNSDSGVLYVLKKNLEDAQTKLSELMAGFDMSARQFTDIDWMTHYNQILEANNQVLTLEYKIQEEENKIKEQRIQNWQDLASGIGSIMGSISDIMEEEGSKSFEAIKGLRIAEATINTINGAISAFMGCQSLGQPWGAVLGGVQAAAVTAAGIAEIAKIKNTKIGSSSSLGNTSTSTAAVTPVIADYTPDYTSNLTTQTETENLANALTKTSIWVSVTDIDNAQSKTRARVSETTF